MFWLNNSCIFMTLALSVLFLVSAAIAQMDSEMSAESSSNGSDGDIMDVLDSYKVADPRLQAVRSDRTCSRRRSNFVRYGCTTKESTYCTALNRALTRDIKGKPACLDYPCEGYGNPVGFFLCNATCVDGTPDSFGICAGSDICCLT